MNLGLSAAQRSLQGRLRQAAIQQAEAALESARINLGYTRITAPISGRIGRSNVTEGAIVTAYQPLALQFRYLFANLRLEYEVHPGFFFCCSETWKP